MRTRHTISEYISALEAAGILLEAAIPESLTSRAVDCLTYDTRKLSPNALFICKGAHFKEEYLTAAMQESLQYGADLFFWQEIAIRDGIGWAAKATPEQSSILSL